MNTNCAKAIVSLAVVFTLPVQALDLQLVTDDAAYRTELDKVPNRQLNDEISRQQQQMIVSCSGGKLRALVSGVLGTIPLASTVQRVARQDVPSTSTNTAELIGELCGSVGGGIIGGVADLIGLLPYGMAQCHHALNPMTTPTPAPYKTQGLHGAYDPAINDWTLYVSGENSECQRATRRFQTAMLQRHLRQFKERELILKRAENGSLVILEEVSKAKNSDAADTTVDENGRVHLYNAHQVP